MEGAGYGNDEWKNNFRGRPNRYGGIKMMKQLKLLCSTAFAVVLVFSATVVPNASAQTFDPTRIIDDTVFDNKNSMTIAQVDAFLNSFPSSCLSTKNGFTAPDPIGFNPTQGYLFGGNVTGGTAIVHAAQAYDLNPQVLLTTLQKEQSLVSGGKGCHPNTPDPTKTFQCDLYNNGRTYNCTNACPWALGGGCIPIAVGYGCPGRCDAAKEGFSNQIIRAAWLLKFSQQRAKGNIDWAIIRGNWDNSDDLDSCYSGPMTKGNWQVCPSGGTSPYDGLYTPKDGTTIELKTGATAALYYYTPFLSGNKSFFNTFTSWFGPTNGSILTSLRSYVSGLKWGDKTTNSGLTGTTGQSRPMEAFLLNGEVEYTSYSYSTGWQPVVSRGMISGTTEQSKYIQAIKINPIGSLATNYDIYYRAHVSEIGWMGWSKNNAAAGITGDSAKNIEAFEISLVSKGGPAPGTTTNAYQNVNTITYSPPVSLGVTSHVESVGWQPTVTDRMTSGTTGQKKRVEAIKIALNNTSGFAGNISYSAHVATIGWQNIVQNGAVAGTTGQSKQMEAVRIALTGALGDNYDVWYKAHIASIGWTGWAKNGQAAGSMGANLRLEALEVRVVPKNSVTLSQTGALYNPKNKPLPDSYALSVAAHVSNIGWMNSVAQNQVSGTTGQSKTVEALRFGTTSSMFGEVAITCSAYVRDSGWMNDIAPTNTCGVTGQSKPLQALKLKLSGTAASKYDIYYKVHLSKLGWQDWVKNDEQAGSLNTQNPIEAVTAKLVLK